MAIRLLVCGGRDFLDYDCAKIAIDRIHQEYGVGVLIEGGARGADSLGMRWQKSQNDEKILHAQYPADWNRYGPRAGPIRNKQMLTEGKPHFVMCFPGGTGTANMKKISLENEAVVVLGIHRTERAIVFTNMRTRIDFHIPIDKPLKL